MVSNGETIQLPDYFTEILEDVIKCEGITDYNVDVQWGSGKGENYLGVIYRIIVKGIKDNQETYLRLILKISPESDVVREKMLIGKIYSTESFIYDTLSHEFNRLQEHYNIPKNERFNFTKGFRTSKEHKKEFLLLEDLCDQGFKLANRRIPLEYDHVQMIIESLARYHALSFVMQRDDPEKFQEFTKNTVSASEFDFDDDNFTNMAVKKVTDVLDDDVLIEKAQKFRKSINDRLKLCLSPEPFAPYNVIVHGDCWNNNLMFRIQNGKVQDCRFLDWQMSKYCSPLTDILYFIFNSTDYEFRKEHFQDIMDLYHKTLGMALTKMNMKVEDCYPRKAFDENVQKILPYGLAIGISLLPFILGESDDAPDVEGIFSKPFDGDQDTHFKSEEANSRYKNRIEGLLRSFEDFGIL